MMDEREKELLWDGLIMARALLFSEGDYKIQLQRSDWLTIVFS
jgi:hypothetical protein